MAELSHCPFCGGAELRHHVAYGSVQCKTCGATGPTCPSSPDCHVKEAAAWNRRAAPAVQALGQAEPVTQPDESKMPPRPTGHNGPDLDAADEPTQRELDMALMLNLRRNGLLGSPLRADAGVPPSMVGSDAERGIEKWLSTSDQRQRFEAWADDQGFPLRRLETSDGYLDLRTHGAWDAWQACASLGVAPTEGGNDAA